MAVETTSFVQLSEDRRPLDDDLAQALASSAGLCRHAKVQILAGILLRAASVGSLAATDMEMSLRALDAAVDGDGASSSRADCSSTSCACCLRAKSSSRTRLTRRRSSYVRRRLLPAQHVPSRRLPRLPEVEPATLVSVSTQALLETIAKVSRAASRDESRPVLTGILVRLEGPARHGRDRHVPPRREGDRARAEPGRELEAIVPARALGELVRIGPGRPTPTQIDSASRRTRSCSTSTGRAHRPADRRAVPELPSAAAGELRGRDQRLRARSCSTPYGVSACMAQRNAPLRLRFEEGELTIQAQTQDVGEATSHSRSPYNGDVLEIGFNPDFLREGLESVDEDQVRLRLITPLRPGSSPAPARTPGTSSCHQARRLEVLSVSHVALHDFRSYARQELELVPGLVLVVGPNGAGKTNLLEAIHVGSQGFSFRTRREMPASSGSGPTLPGWSSRGTSRGPAVPTQITVDRGREADRRSTAQRSGSRTSCAAAPGARLHARPPGRRQGRPGDPTPYLDRMVGRLSREGRPPGRVRARRSRSATRRSGVCGPGSSRLMLSAHGQKRWPAGRISTGPRRDRRRARARVLGRRRGARPGGLPISLPGERGDGRRAGGTPRPGCRARNDRHGPHLRTSS